MPRPGVPAVLAALLVLGCDEVSTSAAGLDAEPADADAAGPPVDAAMDAESDRDGEQPPDGRPIDLGPPPVRWPGPDTPPAFDLNIAIDHPSAFARLSRWAGDAADPRTGARGAFAVGNGQVFALGGLVDPITTLHGVTGPTYDRGTGYFGDQALVFADGPFDDGVIAQSLSAPVVVIRACRGPRCLRVVDFALPGRPCIVRHLELRGGEADVALVARDDAVLDGDAILEQRGERWLATRFPGAVAVDGRLQRRLVADEAARVTLCAAIGEPPADPGDIDVGAALDALATDWQADRAGRVTAELPDPRLADFVDGVARALTVQTAAFGAVSPMHRYTRLWLRDSIGPVLAWSFLGEHERVARILDALDAETRRAGDLRNSMAADRDPGTAPPAPDYGALPRLTGRTGAEGPSYLVLIHAIYARHTGDLEPARRALPLLRRALLEQDFAPDDRLPFSGDETFRIALDAAFGLTLGHPHEEASWSANSLVLWLGAADALRWLAAALDTPELVAEIDARRPRVEEAIAPFFDDDGCLAALIDRETGARSAPFEDVSLKPTWAGWLPGDDARARANVRCLVDRLGVAPGVLQSPLAPQYAGLPVLAGGSGSGVFTGMQPAYTLSALTAVDHPWAPHALHALGAALLPDGMPQEYQVRADAGPLGLSLVYDPTGREADQTPKLRPWEGGIALHAVAEHLLGFAPDAVAGRLDLTPRLPPGWPGHTWRDLRVGPVRLDVYVDAEAVEVHVDGDLEVRVFGVTRRSTPDAPAVFPWRE